MKNLIQFLFIALVATACSSGGDTDTSDLGMMIKERDSLKLVKADLSAKLAELETTLAELDTTKKLQLITLTPAVQKRFSHFFTVHGVVETDQMAMVNPESQGKYLSIKVKEGDRVSKGQTLAIQDSKIVQKQIKELETQLDLAQTMFERQEKLWKQNVGSEIQFFQAKAKRDGLQDNLQLLNEQLQMTVLKAPFAGIIDDIQPKEGEMPNPQMYFCRLINLDEVYIKADVSENYLSKVNKGDSVLIRLPNTDMALAKSEISRVGNFINPNNRTFKITVKISNKDNKLKPNMLAEVDIRDYTADSSIVIPENLILRGAGDRKFVFVAEKGNGNKAVVTKKSLNTGKSYKQQTEIISGLKKGDLIVDKGARSIQEGEVVEISSTQTL